MHGENECHYPSTIPSSNLQLRRQFALSSIVLQTIVFDITSFRQFFMVSSKHDEKQFVQASVVKSKTMDDFIGY